MKNDIICRKNKRIGETKTCVEFVDIQEKDKRKC